ncbi:putative prenyl cysteine carboxyl methyltransferase [Amylocarpus encephaloides]|uniref:Protein-S-isoprenylcysteine O-methyltransferase n=1 Tax=Amylocarpus encephaloides TaxID=45428 RepID=A0A9P7YL70_9HELO|nr:putative prenyl cysteine carboxyl methyltransferase [Amylocarpus encephaloides]
MPPTLSHLLLALAFGITGHLSYLCYTPPSGAPSKPYTTDRFHFIANLHTYRNNLLLKVLMVPAFTLQILLILFPSQGSNLCRNPDLLNPALFTWSFRFILYLLSIAAFGGLRLAAYRHLGTNFTFTLAVPKKLVTTGVYKYVQHPSYTALIGVSSASLFFLARLDGIAACVLPAWMVVAGLSEVGAMVGLGLQIVGLRMRITDEEEMMKGEFGAEWERWHARTKRVLPGLI